jgi:hypothetical protein
MSPFCVGATLDYRAFFFVRAINSINLFYDIDMLALGFGYDTEGRMK